MPKYMYKATHSSGQDQEGVIEATNIEIATQMIRERGYYPQSITSIVSKDEKQGVEFGKKIKIRDLAMFCSQFAVILQAGVSILQSLDILSEQAENKKLKKVLIDVQARIQRGSSISEAFIEHKERFPDIFISMIQTGEASGNLDLVLKKMGETLLKDYKLSQKIKTAMIYPIILSTVAILVVVFLLVSVVPTFSSMYSSSGQELPGLTRLMLSLGDFFAQNLFWIALIIAILAVITNILLKLEPVKYEYDRIKIRIPIFGKLLLKIITARFTQNMSTLLSSGISLTQAISITSRSVGNYYVGKKLEGIVPEIRSGRGLSVPLSELEIFSPMVVHMTRLGEESGSLDELLIQTALFYESESETATAKLTAMVEPLIIVVMGAMVLIIVLSILLPMLGMYDLF